MNARSPVKMQAALKQIKGSNGRPLWPGPIDGRNTPRDIDSLAAAIAGFESKINRRISGVIAPGGDSNALSGMSPNNYQDMHGVPGTAIVAGHVARRTPKPDGGVETLALPEEYKDDLGRIVSKLKDALNWLPTVRLGPTDAQGRCEVTVDLGLRFLDAQGRVPSKSATLPPAVAKVVAQALSQPGRFSPPSRLTYALTLKSREPLCFPAAKLAGGSAAWPLFTGSVGKAGGNAIHDVACLQAALANIEMPGTASAFWRGGIDGKASSGLNTALTSFQTVAGLDASGTVKPGDATVKALSALLPGSYKGLRGIRGLAAAAVEDDTGGDKIGFEPWPESLSDIIAPLDTAAKQRHGVGLVLRERPLQRHDRLHMPVTLGGGNYLDDAARQMSALLSPPAVHSALAALTAADGRVGLDPNAAPGRTVLTVTGKAESGEAIDIEYRESQWFTVIELPPGIKTGVGPEDEAGGNIVTVDMLVAAGYEASKAYEIIRKFGVRGTLHWHGGASGNRFLIIRGHGGRLGLLDQVRHAKAHSAVIAMGVTPESAARVRLTASGIGIVLIGAIEMHQFLTGEQDIVETVVNMGFGLTGLAISGFLGTLAAAAVGLLTIPAWVPIATMAGTGLLVGAIYNYYLEESELDAEVERVLRYAIEEFDDTAIFSDSNFGP